MVRRFEASLAARLALGVSLAAHAPFIAVSYDSRPRSVASELPISAERLVDVEADRAPAQDAPPLENRANGPAAPSSVGPARAKQAPSTPEPARLLNVVTAPDAPTATPHFVIAMAAGAAGANEATPSAGALATAEGMDREADRDAVLSADAVDVPATLSRGQIADYPPSARENDIEADVGLELVVSREGAVEGARSLRHVGYGLDEAALTAARGFRFTPAMKRGKAVRVRVRWTVEFRLQ